MSIGDYARVDAFDVVVEGELVYLNPTPRTT
jgi:hypothetical protein